MERKYGERKVETARRRIRLEAKCREVEVAVRGDEVLDTGSQFSVNWRWTAKDSRWYDDQLIHDSKESNVLGAIWLQDKISTSRVASLENGRKRGGDRFKD